LALDPFACYREKVRAGRVTQKSLDEMEELRDLLRANRNDPDQIAEAQRVLELMEHRQRVRKVQTSLQFAAFQRASAQMDKAVQRRSVLRQQIGGQEAGLALLTPDPRGVYTGTNNVEHLSESIARNAQGLFIDAMEKLRRSGFGLVDSADQKALVREIMEALYGNQNVSQAAKDIAASWGEVDDYLIREIRRGGADVVQRRDFKIPQRHDPASFKRAANLVNDKGGRFKYKEHLDAWKSYITPRLNRTAMKSRVTGQPLTDDELDVLLDEMFDNVYTDGMNRFEAQKVGQAKKPPRRLADRHTLERVIVFRDAEAHMEYVDMFGGGFDLFSTMTGHIDKRSREAAFLQILGPDPDATMDLLGNRARAIDGEDPNILNGVYRELTGRLEAATGQGTAWAHGGRAVRNVLTAAQLGGAFISAIADVGFQALASFYNGVSFGRVFSRQMQLMIRGAYDKTDLKFAARLGIAAEEWSGSALSAVRVMGELNGPRVTRKAVDAVMRASLLSQWTQAGRQAFGLEFLGALADETDKAFDAINPALKRALERRGMTAAEWDQVRSVPLASRTNNPGDPGYLDPPSIMAAGHRDAALKLMQTIQEEQEFAVPSGNARVRANLKGAFRGGEGLEAGTLPGELMRFAGQYKSFPVTLMYTHLSRYFFDPAVGAMSNRIGYTAFLFSSMTLMGAIAVNAKNILAGKDPIDPAGENAGAFWAAAALQGGALGLFGDFLFSDHSRFGKSPFLSAAGPGASLFDDVVKLTQGAGPAVWDEESNYGREITRFIGNYAPGNNLWYTRLAFERIAQDQLQYMLDPDAARSFRAKANRAQRDFGTSYWWAPGTTSPQRSPDYVPPGVENLME